MLIWLYCSDIIDHPRQQIDQWHIMTEVKECAEDKKEGGQLFGTRKTKTTKTTLCAHQQDYHLVWFLGIMPCRYPDTHTHTYIHTLHTYRRIAASRAMLRVSSSVSSRTSIPTDSAPRKCKGRIRRSAYCPVCMYVFIRILPTGWEVCQFIRSTIHA